MKSFNSELKINIEFKSFSIKYMTWLFSQSESKNLYKDFISKNGEKIFKGLLESINTDIKSEKDYSKFIKNLHYYINNLTKIYGNIEIENIQLAPVSPIPPINSFLEELYGPDINIKKDNFLNIYRNRSKSRLEEDVVNEQEEILLNDLFFQNSYGDLNVSNDNFNENLNDYAADNILNE